MEPILSSSIRFSQGRVSGSPALPQRILSSLAHWQRRAVSRRQLALLDSRLLADAGISEAQRQVELSKPFWR